MSRFNAILLLAIVSWIPPAFSADEPTSTTTRARIIGNPPPPAPRPPLAPEDDIDPASGLARSTVVKPLLDVPPVPGSDRPVPRPQPGARPHIALILPTASPALGRLAEAVRMGFQAAVEAAGKEALPVSVVAVENEGAALVDACRQEQVNGAFFVVAGLTRDGATALAKSDCARQPTLALNEPQVAPGDPPTVNLFTVSLSLEHEARQVALQAVADGMRSAVVIASPSPLAKRVQEAFEREWTRAAGEVHRVGFSGNPEDAQYLRDQILRIRGGDMVFFALDSLEARSVRPYVPATLPVYATSMSVNPRAETIVNVDLQGLRYVEMPWFVQPDHPAVMAYAAPKAPMSLEQERLYAYGIDAYRLVQHLLRGEVRRSPLDGVTGRIALEPGNVLARTLVPTEVDGGHVIPLRPH